MTVSLSAASRWDAMTVEEREEYLELIGVKRLYRVEGRKVNIPELCWQELPEGYPLTLRVALQRGR